MKNVETICDRCWKKLFPGKEPVRIRALQQTYETCCECGEGTKSGIPITSQERTVH